MKDKVYVIFMNNLEDGRKSVYAVFANKEKAKVAVDTLNADVSEDDSIDYTLESHDVLD